MSPPMVDGHYLEGESLSVDMVEAAPPELIFGGVAVAPVLMPTKFHRLWSYGDLFTVALKKLEERGQLHLRIQSSATALWSSHEAFLDAAHQLAQAFDVQALRTTRLDIAVDVEGLDVVHDLIDYIVGHRGGPGGGVLFRPGKNGGRQIEIGQREGAKRFLRIYLKSAMDCAVYLPTWILNGYSGGRVVRVEVELKNGGLPTREPAAYLDAKLVADLFGDAVARYRVVTTPENRRPEPGAKRASRKSRAKTHAAWAGLLRGAHKWMAPPDPRWTKRQRLDAARSRASRALGGLAARLKHRYAEMEDIDEALAVLRAMGPGEAPAEGAVVMSGPAKREGLIEELFARAREETLKREALLDERSRQRETPPIDPAVFDRRCTTCGGGDALTECVCSPQTKAEALAKMDAAVGPDDPETPS